MASSKAHLVLTHSLAAPRTVYPRPQYNDVTAEVVDFLESRVTLAVAAGIPESRLVVDPGHDLNKNTTHSLTLTREFGRIASLGLPALAAVSNKDFIGESLGQPKAERLPGSLAAASFCLHEGARIIRMHDVSASVSAARMFECVAGWREPAYLLHNQGQMNVP